MKKYAVLPVASFLIVVLLAAANSQTLIDGFASWALSRRFGASIQAHHVQFLKGGRAAFKNLTVSRQKDGAMIFRAASGVCTYGRFFRHDPAGVFILENVICGDYFKKKASILSYWAKAEPFMFCQLSRVVLRIRSRGDFFGIHVLQIKAPDFEVAGGVVVDKKALRKMDLRCLVSENIFSRWPRVLRQKMTGLHDGRLAFSVLYGGRTWTLRGRHGPVIQFAADFVLA